MRFPVGGIDLSQSSSTSHRETAAFARLSRDQVEVLGAGVALDLGGALVGGGEIGAGDLVGAGLVAARGHGLRDGQGQAVGGLGDREGARRVLAGGVLDLGEGAVAGDQLGALDRGGLAVAGLEDTEGVPIRGGNVLD